MVVAQQLTAVLKRNTKGNNEESEALSKVADLFEVIAIEKADVVKKKTSLPGIASDNIQTVLQGWRKANLQGWRKSNLKGCMTSWLLNVRKRLLSGTKVQTIQCPLSQITSRKNNSRNSCFNKGQKELQPNHSPKRQ